MRTITPRRALFLSRLLAVLLLSSPAALWAGEEGYEAAPVRSATQILGADHAQGPGYTVREKVGNRGFLHQFEIESRFGLYEAGSRRMLKLRLHEIETMQRLLKMGETNAYMKALETKLISLPTSLISIVKDPVSTIKNVPQAATKTFGRVGSFLGGIGKKGKGGAKMSPDKIRDELVAAQKRRLAIELKVDAHSSNPKLQQMLENVATARYAGELTVSLASFAIPGAAGSALYSTASYNTEILTLLADKTDTELVAYNRQTLQGLGIHRYLVKSFLAAPHLSLRHQTLITTAATALRGVKGLGAVPETALEAVDETRALLQEEQTIALAAFHKHKEPLAQLQAVGGIVLARSRTGAVVVMAPVDLIWYDRDAARILGALMQTPMARGATTRSLHVKGRVTQRFVDAARASGFEVVSGWPWMPKEKR